MALNLNFLELLENFANALLNGNLDQQIELTEKWNESPSRKLGYLHRFFVCNYLIGVRQLHSEDAVMSGISEQLRQSLLRGVSERARRLGLPEETVWQSIIRELEPRESISEYQLVMILSRLNHLTDQPLPSSRPAEVNVPPSCRVLRVIHNPAEPCALAGEYLEWSQIRPLWRAASFLPQHYGALLNLRVTFRHRGNTTGHHVAAANLVSAFTHQMSMRLNEWNPIPLPRFHWLYRHEADGAGNLVTRIVLSLPDEHLLGAMVWLKTKFSARHHVSLLSAFRTAKNSRRLRFHWNSIRSLSRSLNPTLIGRSEEHRRIPLVDLLQIPGPWREPIGRVLCTQSRGTSASLGPTAQRLAAADRMGFLSAFEDCAWHSVDSGWELLEYHDRQAELRRRREQSARVHALFGEDDQVMIARLAEEIALLKGRYRKNPKQRLRSWFGWWQAELPKREKQA